MTNTEKRLREFDEKISNVMGIRTIDSLRIKDFLTESIQQAVEEERVRIIEIIKEKGQQQDDGTIWVDMDDLLKSIKNP